MIQILILITSLTYISFGSKNAKINENLTDRENTFSQNKCNEGVMYRTYHQITKMPLWNHRSSIQHYIDIHLHFVGTKDMKIQN